jgi:hypothetical protein
MQESIETARLCNANFGENDLHIILTYKNSVAQTRVKKDILSYLLEIRKTFTSNYEYCYKVNSITDGHPAIHILIKTVDSLDQEKLKSLWGNGIVKVALLENFDKRAVSYYFKSWNSDLHRSRGFEHEYIY